MSQNIEWIFPFLVFIVIFIVQGLLKKKGKKPEKVRHVAHPFHQRVQVPPSLPIEKVLLRASSSRKKQEGLRKKKPRIEKLVRGLKSKKELILLSEILSRKCDLK